MNKVQDARKWLEVFIGFCLLGIIVGGSLYVRAKAIDNAQKHEVALIKQLQESRIGDYVIMKNGEVIKVQIVTTEFSADDRYVVSYNMRMTSGGYFRKPLREIARDAAAVVNPMDANYRVVDKCFFAGKYVTTMGAERLTCGK